jgi:hypothetical protein
VPLTHAEHHPHRAGPPTTHGPRHAVVVGAGMCGLTAAQALSGHFERVTLVERHDLPGRPTNRSGTPQSRPADVLQPDCLAALERLLPGFGAALVASGAVRPASQALVEWVTRRLVMDTPQIIVRSGLEVTGLVVTQPPAPGTGGRVRAVAVRPRGAATAIPTECIVADLVVDASGRCSRAPEWLAAAGYDSPCRPDGLVAAGEVACASAAEALGRSVGDHLARHGDISGVAARAQRAMAAAIARASSGAPNVEEER